MRGDRIGEPARLIDPGQRSNSGGSLRLVLTYCSNSVISERPVASISRGSRL